MGTDERDSQNGGFDTKRCHFGHFLINLISTVTIMMTGQKLFLSGIGNVTVHLSAAKNY